MNMNQEIGNRIKTLRKKVKLTQKELATHVGITEQGVSKWERGEALPDISKLLPLSEILGINVDELLGKKVTVEKPSKPKYFESKFDEICYNNDLEQLRKTLKSDKNMYLMYDINGQPILYYAVKYKQYDLILELLDTYKDSNKSNLLLALKGKYYKELTDIITKIKKLLFSKNNIEALKKYGMYDLSNLKLSDYKKLFLKKSKFAQFQEIYKKLSTTEIKEVLEYTIEKNLNEFTFYIYDELVKLIAYNQRNTDYRSAVKEKPSQTTKRLYGTYNTRLIGNRKQDWRIIANTRSPKHCIIVPDYTEGYEFIYEYAVKHQNEEVLEFLNEKGNQNVLLKYAIKHNNIKLINRYDNEDPWTEEIEYQVLHNEKYQGSKESLPSKTTCFRNKKRELLLESGDSSLYDFLIKKTKHKINIQEALVLGKYDKFKDLINTNELMSFVKLLNTKEYDLIRETLIEFFQSVRFEQLQTAQKDPNFIRSRDKILSYLEVRMNDDSIHADELIEALKAMFRKELQHSLSSTIITSRQVQSLLGHTELGDLGLLYFIHQKDYEMVEFIAPYSLQHELNEAHKKSDSKKIREILSKYI